MQRYIVSQFDESTIVVVDQKEKRRFVIMKSQKDVSV